MCSLLSDGESAAVKPATSKGTKAAAAMVVDDEGKREEDREPPRRLLDFCERFMEFLIDLLCQLPTRYEDAGCGLAVFLSTRGLPYDVSCDVSCDSLNLRGNVVRSASSCVRTWACLVWGM